MIYAITLEIPVDV